MLRGGNRRVQTTMYEYFVNTIDEHFFDHIRTRFGTAIRELKNIYAEQQKLADVKPTSEEGFGGEV